MKRGKLINTDGILQPYGETIKEVEKEDGYKYLNKKYVYIAVDSS